MLEAFLASTIAMATPILLAALGELIVERVAGEVSQLLSRVVLVGGDLVDPGTGQQSTLRAGMTGTDRLVVRVEQIPEPRVERSIAGEMGGQDKGLEKPAGVGPVPLGRAGVGHRLDRLILSRQRPGQLLGQAANLHITVGEQL